MNFDQYAIQCSWDSRSESIQSLADRSLGMTRALNKIEPSLGIWTFEGAAQEDPKPIEAIKDELPELIYKSAGDEMADGSPALYAGYSFSLADGGLGRPSKLFSLIIAGADTQGHRSAAAFSNNVLMMTAAPPDGQKTQPFVTFETFRSMMLALAQNWDASYCRAYSNDLQELWPDGRHIYFFASWMTLLSPEFAAQITPPKTIEVETLPGGALLMVATRERFDAANPSHLAAAEAIQAALAPLNEPRRSMTR